MVPPKLNNVFTAPPTALIPPVMTLIGLVRSMLSRPSNVCPKPSRYSPIHSGGSIPNCSTSPSRSSAASTYSFTCPTLPCRASVASASALCFAFRAASSAARAFFCSVSVPSFTVSGCKSFWVSIYSFRRVRRDWRLSEDTLSRSPNTASQFNPSFNSFRSRPAIFSFSSS